MFKVCVLTQTFSVLTQSLKLQKAKRGAACGPIHKIHLRFF